MSNSDGPTPGMALAAGLLFRVRGQPTDVGGPYLGENAILLQPFPQVGEPPRRRPAAARLHHLLEPRAHRRPAPRAAGERIAAAVAGPPAASIGAQAPKPKPAMGGGEHVRDHRIRRGPRQRSSAARRAAAAVLSVAWLAPGFHRHAPSLPRRCGARGLNLLCRPDRGAAERRGRKELPRWQGAACTEPRCTRLPALHLWRFFGTGSALPSPALPPEKRAASSSRHGS